MLLGTIPRASRVDEQHWLVILSLPDEGMLPLHIASSFPHRSQNIKLLFNFIVSIDIKVNADFIVGITKLWFQKVPCQFYCRLRTGPKTMSRDCTLPLAAWVL